MNFDKKIFFVNFYKGGLFPEFDSIFYRKLQGKIKRKGFHTSVTFLSSFRKKEIFLFIYVGLDPNLVGDTLVLLKIDVICV